MVTAVIFISAYLSLQNQTTKVPFILGKGKYGQLNAIKLISLWNHQTSSST
jgi:hypothetical protein